VLAPRGGVDADVPGTPGTEVAGLVAVAAAALAGSLLLARFLVRRRQRVSSAPIVLLLAVAAVGTIHEATGGPRYWRGWLPVPA
jgi:hypothetical protein